jgi:hypothetical protein
LSSTALCGEDASNYVKLPSVLKTKVLIFKRTVLRFMIKFYSFYKLLSYRNLII